MGNTSTFKLCKDDSHKNFLYTYYYYEDENGNRLSAPDSVRFCDRSRALGPDLFGLATEFENGFAIISASDYTIDQNSRSMPEVRVNAWMVINEKGETVFTFDNVKDMEHGGKDCPPLRIGNTFMGIDIENDNFVVYNASTGATKVLEEDEVRLLSTITKDADRILETKAKQEEKEF